MKRIFKSLLCALPLWLALTFAAPPADNDGRIGIHFIQNAGANGLTINYVAAHSPAAEAGIEEGDLITVVNGIATRNMSPEQTNLAFTGAAGSTLKVAVSHAGGAAREIIVVQKSILETFESAAQEGDPKAQYELGLACQFGESTSADMAKAVEWYRKSANQGYAPAQNKLGYMCEHGLGTAKDETAAFHWYAEAAKQGEVPAENNLALQYLDGHGTARNYQEAYNWFYIAAIQGNRHAQASMGMLYQKGLGVTQDFTAASEWYLKAAMQGDAWAQANLACLYYDGAGVKKDQHTAFAWFCSAAAQGEPVAEYWLGFYYETGLEVPRDAAIAAQWYLKSAKQGNAWAQKNLAHLCYHGNGVPVDERKAFAWYYSAAVQGDAHTQDTLGYLYEYGFGTNKDVKAAAEWYLKAAQQGNATAQRRLAFLYLNGQGVPQNYKTAFAWFYSAAMQDDAIAQVHLANLYREGSGVPKNYHDAFAWYYRSAQLGDHYGERGLAYMYQMGLGVHADPAEAFKWYRKAAPSFTNDEDFQVTLVNTALRSVFADANASSTAKLSRRTIFNRIATWASATLVFVSLMAAIALFLVTFLQPRGKPTKLRIALGWILFYVGGQLVAVLVIIMFGKTFTVQDLLTLFILCFGIPAILSTLGPRRVWTWRAPEGSWKTVLLCGLATYFMFMAVSCSYEILYKAFAHTPLPPQSTSTLINEAKHVSQWLTYAVVALIAPVAEEVIFRGYLFDGLQKRFPALITIAASAFVFTFIHFQLLYFIPLFGLGIALGWARWKTNSIHIPIAIHILNNAIAVFWAGRNLH